MILVLAGTSEGREIVKFLSALKYNVLASTTTPYGGGLLAETGAAEVVVGRLDQGALTELIKTKKIRVVVDATHPFAEMASLHAQNACQATGTLYIRFERPAYEPPVSSLVYTVTHYEEAARMAVELAPKTIFLTTGIKTLPLFVGHAQRAGKRIVARIVPDLAGLKKCFDLGLGPGDVIAMLGPVSRATNKAMLREYHAHVLVTKESGPEGGTGAKVEAALELALPVVIISRPQKYLWAAYNQEQLMHQIKTGKGSVRIG